MSKESLQVSGLMGALVADMEKTFALGAPVEDPLGILANKAATIEESLQRRHAEESLQRHHAELMAFAKRAEVEEVYKRCRPFMAKLPARVLTSIDPGAPPEQQPMTPEQAERVLNRRPASGETPQIMLRDCQDMLVKCLVAETRRTMRAGMCDEFDMVYALTQALRFTHEAFTRQRSRDGREQRERETEARALAGIEDLNITIKDRQGGELYAREETDRREPQTPGLPRELQPPGEAGEAAAPPPQKEELRPAWAGDWLKGS